MATVTSTAMTVEEFSRLPADFWKKDPSLDSLALSLFALRPPLFFRWQASAKGTA